MASCAQPETPLGVWASLARIRDISRLVLAAIERDDLVEIERLSREGQALLAVVQPVLQRMATESPLPEDIGTQMQDLGRSYQAIVKGLQERKDAIQRQLDEVRHTQSRLRHAGLEEARGPSLLDRTT